jgi:hypothetical protein
MARTREEVLEDALQLSDADRLVVANRLLETLSDYPGLDSDDPDFAAELERRSGDWEGAVPWEQLRDEI